MLVSVLSTPVYPAWKKTREDFRGSDTVSSMCYYIKFSTFIDFYIALELKSTLDLPRFRALELWRSSSEALHIMYFNELKDI